MTSDNAGPIRFGLDVPTFAGPGADPVGDARQAERLGFDFVSASDHPCGTDPTYETWTMLTWIAAGTSRIGIATRVLSVPLRAPAMVAKMAATLDDLADGRLILGLGGGSADDEIRGFGLRVPTARGKVDGLAEAVQLIRGLWSRSSITFDGTHHITDRAELEPKPVRDIPIWLGTFGPRALAVTGRLADGWMPSLSHAPPDRVGALRERVLAAAAEAGRRPHEITCAYNVEVRLLDGPEPRPDTSPTVVSGTSQAVAERLLEFVALGFTVLNVKPVGPDRRGQVERLGREVLPAVRAAAVR
ncbi:luciferase-like monooxygenase [Haloactinopolyspora alba]|uniref:Luciferase-like monooxygenase n=1 Tax=Haloactinopolyspora alba TaxID=648780 RepID=A0A2P8DYW4_9ACTN|nr:LLM class flavin-dependent oxidoreductase [Haloactinopolyspora alba]PSL02412.1 luciferase-like monooxygenase [Haloactinopolyspora alba]